MTEPIWKGGMTAEEQIDTVNLARAYLAFSAEQRAYFQGYTEAAQSKRREYGEYQPIAPAPTKRKRGRPVGSKTRKPAAQEVTQ
jgi:hypothetical protein